MRRRWEPILRSALALLFIGAALTKVADPVRFAADVRAYQLLPDRLATVFALWLPWVEIWSGLALFRPRYRRPGLGILAGLTVLFIGALASAWIRGLTLTCGCFGSEVPETGMGYGLLLLRDGAILACLLGLLRASPTA